MSNIWKRYMDWKANRISDWFNQGIEAYKVGTPPTNNPHRYRTRAYIYWLAGWTSQWRYEYGQQKQGTTN